MSSLPRKSVTGLPLKKYVLDTLNGLIDYCHTHRIKAGKGIDVRETASGYVIGLAQPPSNPPQVLNAGGGADGIEASVTGGTASIALTGGTGSVNLVGTGAVTITRNTTTGDIEINATGSTSSVGFPDYTSNKVSANAIVLDTTYGAYAFPVWVVGYMYTEYDNADTQIGNIWVDFYENGVSAGGIHLFDVRVPDDINGEQGLAQIPLLLPIPSGLSFKFTNQNSFGQIQAYIHNCV
jgi:hypothetical protein